MNQKLSLDSMMCHTQMFKIFTREKVAQFYILILGKLIKKCGVMEDDELINNNNNKLIIK